MAYKPSWRVAKLLLERHLAGLAALSALAAMAATCRIDPDAYPLARGMTAEEYAILSSDWSVVGQVLARPPCASALGLDREKLTRAHRYALFIRSHVGCQQGLIGWVPPRSSVVALCPAYWAIASQPGRVAILIHELGHVCGLTHEATPEASSNVTRLVLERCVDPYIRSLEVQLTTPPAGIEPE